MTRWLTPYEAATKLGTYPHMLRKLVRLGMPAPSYKQGPRQPRYDEAALDAWMRGEDATAEVTDDRSDIAALAARLAAPKGRSRRTAAAG